MQARIEDFTQGEFRQLKGKNYRNFLDWARAKKMVPIVIKFMITVMWAG